MGTIQRIIGICAIMSGVIYGAFTMPLSAQQAANVSGKVIDSVSGDPIIGVTVIIRAVNIYAVTDIDGNYTLEEVPAGTHKIEFQMSGYDVSETEMNVVPGKKNSVNISMSYRTAKEVVVSAKRISNTDAALINKRKKAAVAQDAISAEQISKSPDSDAGDAAKRVTGVTIVDGKNGKTVFIRGLGERYASVMFAGTPLPSPDPDKKVVPLDIFPTALLDNLVIIKAYTPDMPGEFGGGIVQINPKDYPEEKTMKVSIGTGYHSNTTGKDFLTYDGGKYDFFGYDDGTRDLPNGLGDDYLNESNYTSEETEDIGESLKNEYTPNKTKGKLPLDASFTFGDSYKIGTRTLGLIFSGMFKESSRNKDIHTLRVNNNWQELKDYDIKKSTYSTSSGLLLSTALTGSSNKFRLTSFYSHQSEDSTSIYQGYNNDRQESTTGSISNEKLYKLQFVETGLFFNQFEGEHYFPDFLESTLNWTGSYSRATRTEPDTRTVQLMDQNDTGEYYIYRNDDIKRRFMDHVESVYDFSPSVTIPFKQWSGLVSKLKMGSAVTYRERESENRVFVWQNSGLNTLSSAGEPLEDLFGSDDIVGWGSEDNTHYYLKEVSTQNDSYTGKLTVIAGYGQVDMPLASKLRMVGGIRYEYADMDLISYNPTTTEEENLENEPLEQNNFMPGLSLTYSLTDNTNIRAAYSKTLIRPDFLDVTEYKRETSVPSEVIVGNEDITQCDIHNFDLRMEWFPSASEIIALSFFYKYMINPIELLEITGTAGTATYQAANADSANNMGVEIEARKNMGIFTDLLKDFSLSSNFALIYSRIKVQDKPYADYTSNNRPLQGQSPYIINAGINYDNEDLGLSCAVLYNIYGRRIVRVGTVSSGNKNEDIYEESVGKLDLIIKQNIFKDGQIKFSASNLLDPEIRETQVKPNSSTGEKKKFTLESYREGRNFSISYTYNF